MKDDNKLLHMLDSVRVTTHCELDVPPFPDKELTIGRRFLYKGRTYRCVESSNGCLGCIYQGHGLCCNGENRYCLPEQRTDHERIIYINETKNIQSKATKTMKSNEEVKEWLKGKTVRCANREIAGKVAKIFGYAGIKRGVCAYDKLFKPLSYKTNQVLYLNTDDSTRVRYSRDFIENQIVESSELFDFVGDDTPKSSPMEETNLSPFVYIQYTQFGTEDTIIEELTKRGAEGLSQNITYKLGNYFLLSSNGKIYSREDLPDFIKRNYQEIKVECNLNDGDIVIGSQGDGYCMGVVVGKYSEKYNGIYTNRNSYISMDWLVWFYPLKLRSKAVEEEIRNAIAKASSNPF